MHVLGRVRHRQREEPHGRILGEHPADHGLTTAVGHVHIDEHDVGNTLADQLDGGVDLRRLAHDVDVRTQLDANAGAEQVVVVDEEHTQPSGVAAHGRVRRIVSSTSVPHTARRPHHRGAAVAVHASGDRFRDAAAVVGHRRGIEAAATVADEHAHLLGLDLDVHRHRRRTGVVRRVRHRLAGRGHQCTQPLVERAGAAHVNDVDRHAEALLDVRRPRPRSHRRDRGRRGPAPERTAMTAARAPDAAPSATTARGSSARRWIIVRLWSTESCRCAAISARSSDRIRSLRSSTSAFHNRHSHGPKIEREPAEQDGHGNESLADGIERVVAEEKRAHARDHERAADVRLARSRSCPRPRASGAAALRPRPTSSSMTSSIGLPLRPTISAAPIAARTTGHTSASDSPRPIRWESRRIPSVTAPSAATCTQSERLRWRVDRGGGAPSASSRGIQIHPAT